MLTVRSTLPSIDLWSSRAIEPILGIKFHFFDNDFNMCVKTVAFRHFGERHSAANISAAFEEVLAEYNIQVSSFGYQVTDNAANMIKAFELFSIHAQLVFDAQDLHSNVSKNTNVNDEDNSSDDSWLQGDTSDYDEMTQMLATTSTDDDSDETCSISIDIGVRLPCIAHTLQLALKDGVRNAAIVGKIIKEANAVVVFFHRSLYWACELKKLTGGKTLLAAVVTRWYSNLIMLQRLAQDDIWKSVGEVLAHARAAGGSGTANVPRFTVTKQQILELVSILQPFEEATNTLQGDNVTISSVIPALLGIDDVLSHPPEQTQFPSVRKHLRRALRDRFQHIMLKNEYILSTILDCRYKVIPFADEGDLSAVSEAVLKPITKGEAVRRLASAVEQAKLRLR